MERKTVERRTVLKGSAAAIGIVGSSASTAFIAAVGDASAETMQTQLPRQIQTAFERFRATIPANFDPEYVEKVVVPFFLTSVYEGERPMLPMIDVNFSKEMLYLTIFGVSLRGIGDRPLRRALRSFSKAWRNAVTTTCGKGFTFQR